MDKDKSDLTDDPTEGTSGATFTLTDEMAETVAQKILEKLSTPLTPAAKGKEREPSKGAGSTTTKTGTWP